MCRSALRQKQVSESVPKFNSYDANYINVLGHCRASYVWGLAHMNVQKSTAQWIAPKDYIYVCIPQD